MYRLGAAFSRRFSSSSLHFPVDHTAGRGPNAIFCHGLGSTWDQASALKLQRYAKMRGYAFTRFSYRFVGDLERVWHVDSWTEDLDALVDASFRALGHRQIVIAASASAQPALKIAIAHPEKIDALVLVSPGVGLDLGYMDRVVPGAVRHLRLGRKVLHPGVRGSYDTLVSLGPLMDYVVNCPVNTMDRIPVQCPVHILHGTDDQLVPCANSELLARKLVSAERVRLELIPKVGHHFNFSTKVGEILDQLHSEGEQERRNRRQEFSVKKAEEEQELLRPPTSAGEREKVAATA